MVNEEEMSMQKPCGRREKISVTGVVHGEAAEPSGCL